MAKQIVVLHTDGKIARRYSPISAQEQHFSEDLLQKLVFDEPELLLTDEVNSDFAELVPLCREFPVRSGSIDVVYVTLAGKICLVETKLWRNPEAHRSVVAQIIDYAKDLSRFSFSEFCEAATRAKGEKAAGILFERVGKKSVYFNEIELQRNIQHSLSHGHFLLLIVGDKIYPEVALLAESIQSAPHLEFTISLVELGFYSAGEQENKQLLVAPKVVGKTHEQARAVVKIIYEEKKPEVEVTPVESEKSLLDQETFLKDLGAEGLRVFNPILKLSDLHGLPIHWGSRGFSLNADVGGKHIALCYGYGSKAYGGQRIWTSFTDVINKVQGGEEIVQTLRKQLRQIGVFVETQKEMKYNFKQKMTETQIEDLVDILLGLANSIKNNGTRKTSPN